MVPERYTVIIGIVPKKTLRHGMAVLYIPGGVPTN